MHDNMKRQIGRTLRRFACAAGFLMIFPTLSLAAPSGGPEDPNGPQNRSDRWTEIQNMKIAFFTDALQLTPEQSQKFWPVYNEYWKARHGVGKTRHDLFRAIREGRAGEQQLGELLAVMDAERKIAADYIAKFRRVLPADKVARVFVADEDFKNFLIRRAASGGGKR